MRQIHFYHTGARENRTNLSGKPLGIWQLTKEFLNICPFDLAIAFQGPCPKHSGKRTKIHNAYKLFYKFINNVLFIKNKI